MRHGWTDRMFGGFTYIFIGGFCIFCLLPIWVLIVGSVTDEKILLTEGYQLIPQNISFVGYQLLLAGKSLYQGYGVTVFVTFVGTILAIIVTSALSYSIANSRNGLRNHISFYVYFTMLFNGGLVPIYLLISKTLNLSDSLWALILPLVVNPFYVFLMTNFFRTLPEEIGESGKMDGASEFTIFTRLILPISTPIIATIGLFAALVYWNDWFYGLLFIADENKFPLQLILRRMISNMLAAQSMLPAGASYVVNLPAYQIRMATTVLTIGPIVLLYPFLQKYFVKGLTVGAIKG